MLFLFNNQTSENQCTLQWLSATLIAADRLRRESQDKSTFMSENIYSRTVLNNLTRFTWATFKENIVLEYWQCSSILNPTGIFLIGHFALRVLLYWFSHSDTAGELLSTWKIESLYSVLMVFDAFIILRIEKTVFENQNPSEWNRFWCF